MSGENQAALAADDFAEVFERDDRDRGAESAAPADGQQRDDKGRYAPKPEPIEQPKVEAQPEAARPEQAASEQPEAEVNRHVPLKELLSERERFKSEKKLREEAERRGAERDAEFKAYRDLVQNQQRQPQQQAQQPTPPDPFVEPEQFANYQAQQHHLRSRHDIANMSERIARKAVGDATVDEALNWALQTNRGELYLMRAADPYGELVDDYKKYKTFAEIGPDPDKYKSSLKDQLRAEILAELKAGGTNPAPKYPGTLASATQAGTQGAMLSPESIAHDIFDTNRNRKAW